MYRSGFRGKKHFFSINDFNREELEFINYAAKGLHRYSGGGNKLPILHGYILDPMFFEHSTRTLKSTIAAMETMGGTCLPPHMEVYSSRMKGEPKLDTLVAVSQDCDMIAIRDKSPDTMQQYMQLPDGHNLVPLINCGSGAHEHPTQCETDLRTIDKWHNTLDNLLVLIAGDLKYGRVPHSLIYGLRKFSNNKVVGFRVRDLGLTENYRDNGYEEHDISYLPEFVKQIDPNTKTVLYVTRIQWEREAQKRNQDFDSFTPERKEEIRKEIQLEEYSYEITPSVVDSTSESTIVMHALPRGPELSDELFYYHKKVKAIDQMRNSVPVRMALLGLFLGKEPEISELIGRQLDNQRVSYTSDE